MKNKQTTTQAYLVVYLYGGKVLANYEVVVGEEQARRKCLVHVNVAPPEQDECLGVQPDGAFCAMDGQLLDAWAFPIPATVSVTVVDDNRPANEDQIRLHCEFSTCGIRACHWSGLASEAGWDSRYDEWICPECGSSDGLRIVVADPEQGGAR
jgi:hypothetical protein